MEYHIDVKTVPTTRSNVRVEQALNTYNLHCIPARTGNNKYVCVCVCVYTISYVNCDFVTCIS